MRQAGDLSSPRDDLVSKAFCAPLHLALRRAARRSASISASMAASSSSARVTRDARSRRSRNSTRAAATAGRPRRPAQSASRRPAPCTAGSSGRRPGCAPRCPPRRRPACRSAASATPSTRAAARRASTTLRRSAVIGGVSTVIGGTAGAPLQRAEVLRHQLSRLGDVEVADDRELALFGA